MAQRLASPDGLLSDEEAGVSPVLESTAAECGASLCRALLPDFSSISSGHEQAVSEDSGKVKVYARVRPLNQAKVEKSEDQGCVCIENSETLLLKAPKDSFTMKNIERGIGQAVHKFTFTQVFGPEVGQKAFFDATMKEVVKDVLHGQNWLVYTYGVTNSGKTYTVQGSSTDGGILPRSLAAIFNSIGTRLYRATDLKPFLSSEVVWLNSKQVHQEEIKKQVLLCGNMKEEEVLASVNKSHGTGTSASIDSGVGGLSCFCHSTNQSICNLLEETSPCWPDTDILLLAKEEVEFSIWVSFFEIYNEMVYDLLETTMTGPSRRRPTLRLCEDQTGNPYIKDLNWINVRDADEAWKLLKLGRRNQSFASTHMNQNSSRSHSIFSIRILHLRKNGSEVDPKISELSLCDLAGSERCKEQRDGDRMKEANNINTSLHTLGRCLNVLRQNQHARLKQCVVPFRDSKLTRVFQGFFTGRGQSCMIVNMNPSASSYDETLHVAKFSAIASQLIQAPPKVGLLSIQSLIKEQNIRINKVPSAAADQETEPDEESEDETDVTTFDKEGLLLVVEAVKGLLLKERQEKLKLEMHLRDKICNEMMEHLQQREQWFSEHLDAQMEILEEMYEEKLNNLKESLTDYYHEEIENRDEKIEELEAALKEAQQEVQAVKQEESEEKVRRSKRVAAASALQHQELQETKARLEQYQAELCTAKAELRKCQKLLDPPPSARAVTADVDRKLEDGQKNVRMLRSELQRLGASLQSAERACCHSTSAGKLRETLCMCDEILVKQDQTLAELQNTMMLVKLDLRKKAACIAEQYYTVQKLQGAPTPAIKKRLCATNENMQPKSQPPIKKPFLHNFLPRSTTKPPITESPYTRILRSRRSPLASGKKY